MGKRITTEFFCDVCGEVMDNSKLKTETKIPVSVDERKLDVYVSIHPTPEHTGTTLKRYAVCRNCIHNAIRSVLNLTGK